MDVLINSLALANGANCRHILINVTVNGRTIVREYTRDDLAADPDQDDEQAFLTVIRSMVKTAGATTPAQINAALSGKTVRL